MTRSVKHQHAGMQGWTLLKGCPQGPMQSVFQIQLVLPLHDVSEQIAVEGGLLRQQSCQVKVAFCGDQLIESDHARWDVGPVTGRLQPVRGIGTPVTHSPEDHHPTLGDQAWSGCLLYTSPSPRD